VTHFVLIDNAVKYTAARGRVSLDLSMDHDAADMAVSDTGIGIAAEDVPRIFDRFWRADKARSRERGGVGLGLSIARWIVDVHDGEIRTTSEPGKGSTFRIRLPLLTKSSDSPPILR
jgi:signal transduction histidine kinase